MRLPVVDSVDFEEADLAVSMGVGSEAAGLAVSMAADSAVAVSTAVEAAGSAVFMAADSAVVASMAAGLEGKEASMPAGLRQGAFTVEASAVVADFTGAGLKVVDSAAENSAAIDLLVIEAVILPPVGIGGEAGEAIDPAGRRVAR